MTKDKNHSIETMRGLACLMLVAYHVIGSNGSNGLQVPDNGIVRHICDVLSYLRMPLFAFISGYVYGLCKINKDFMLPSLVHDAFCQMVREKKLPNKYRWKADLLLSRQLKESGTPFWRRLYLSFFTKAYGRVIYR